MNSGSVGRCHRSRPALAAGILLSISTVSSFAVVPSAMATDGQCGYSSTRIRDVQGKAHLSPMDGASVADIHGIVTATSATGFWYQDPCPDSDPTTSEGLFVHTAAPPSVSVGDEISVDGEVDEYRPGGSSTSNLTITEITSPSITNLGSAALPAPVTIGDSGRLAPGTVIDDDAGGNIEESGSFDPSGDGIDFYESLEGMRVRLNDPVAVGPTNDYGEIPVLGDDGGNASVRTARGGIALREHDRNPERVLLDDKVVSGSTPQVRTGDHFSSAAVGVLDYGFGNFKLQLTGELSGVSASLPKERTESQRPGELAVATMNVANLDAKDPQEKFDALARQIVINLAAPDVLSIQEIQDNNGAQAGPPAADKTWTRLIDTMASVGGPAYEYRQIDPVNGADGGEPRGNIRVGFLFRSERVSFARAPHGDATTAVRVGDSGRVGDRVALSHNPGRIQPNDPAFDNSRKPLVGKFHFGGEPVFVIANHFNSKGGDDPLFGRYQPPQRSSEIQRREQAAIVAEFYEHIRAIDPDANVIVAGDLNDFEFSTAIGELTGAGLVDLPATLPHSERYSYIYQGNSQVLDHLLISPALQESGYEFDVVHTNAEYASRASDHDPQVARLNLG